MITPDCEIRRGGGSALAMVSLRDGRSNWFGSAAIYLTCSRTISRSRSSPVSRESKSRSHSSHQSSTYSDGALVRSASNCQRPAFRRAKFEAKRPLCLPAAYRLSFDRHHRLAGAFVAPDACREPWSESGPKWDQRASEVGAISRQADCAGGCQIDSARSRSAGLELKCKSKHLIVLALPSGIEPLSPP